MKTYKIIPFILLFAANHAYGQKILSLKECYESAYASNALAGEKSDYSEISSLKDRNLRNAWLPELNLNANAAYNSSVVDLSSALGSIPVPGIQNAIRPVPHDQYKLTLDINQTIFDGGAIKSSREVERADNRVNQAQTETDLYKLKSQVNALFFNLLLLDRQKNLLGDYYELIDKRLNSVRSGVENGVLMKSDEDVLTSEQINLSQQLSENTIRRMAMLKNLSDLTGIQVDTATTLVIPENLNIEDEEITRPELSLLDMKKEQLDAGEKMLSSGRMPKAFGFATLGYGNPPGNNFFKDQFDTYYMVGAGIRWNIFDWNKTQNEKQIISIRKNIVQQRKTDLTDNLKIQLETKRAEIENLVNLSKSDEELITLRKRISASAESQYQNGIITATEYLNILNSERQALINAEMHRINLALARTEYLNISGKEIE
jgi:outer membrane protein TolC